MAYVASDMLREGRVQFPRATHGRRPPAVDHGEGRPCRPRRPTALDFIPVSLTLPTLRRGGGP
ncbi:hypothetical protein GZL_08065 [Streptomyces sp. 769]|nr:hypothetical protein GZL_08065 [Streptomyces sp. 769]